MEADDKGRSLGMILDGSKTRIMQAVITEQSSYGLPASLIELVIAGILAEVRDMKCREYVMQMGEEEDTGD